MHRATGRFWKLYGSLPWQVQQTARKNFALLKSDPTHPSLHLKKVGKYWVARIDLNYRALALEDGDGLAWFWIGSHDEYAIVIRESS